MIYNRLKKSTRKQEEDFDKTMGEELEKGDTLAMILGAFAVIVVPCLLILVGLVFLCMWLFGIL